MRDVMVYLSGLLLLVCIVLLAATIPARWQILHINPELPDWAALDAALNQAGGPVGLAYINTASQKTSLGELGHPAIVVEWPDGRRFLIDTGMPPEEAQAFGRPIELLGAGPTTTFGAVDAQLGDAVQSVQGIAFTHLHSDHTAGLPGICAAQSQAATVYQAPLQQALNYTTEIGMVALDDAVCPRAVLSEDVIMPVPGFPGLLAVSLGGHTPDSTLYAARVAGKTWIFSGDITNDLRSIRQDIPKPWWYSTLVVPENVNRNRELRAWLKNLDAQPDVTVLPAHDVLAMAAAGLPSVN